MSSQVSAYKLKLPQYLLELIRQFRKRPTHPEKMLWECLRDRRLNGFKFRRQHPIGRYVVDFYCHDARLVVEVDGDIHDVPDQVEYDRIREEELRALELTIVRFPNERVLTETEQVLEEIAALLVRISPSPPTPLPKGEGLGMRAQFEMQNPIFERIYALARHIPYGKVTTYGQLGAMVGLTDMRTVGDAMNASPEDVPWQRVINSRGTISIGGATGGRQRALLEEEGVTFDENGRVDFALVGWVPAKEWLEANGYKEPPPFVKDKKDKKDKDGEQLNLF